MQLVSAQVAAQTFFFKVQFGLVKLILDVTYRCFL